MKPLELKPRECILYCMLQKVQVHAGKTGKIQAEEGHWRCRFRYVLRVRLYRCKFMVVASSTRLSSLFYESHTPRAIILCFRSFIHSVYFKNKEIIHKLCPDVIALQEHWLTPANLHTLSEIFSDYMYLFCRSSSVTNVLAFVPLVGRPHGGTGQPCLLTTD